MVMSDLPRGRALARAYIVDDDKSYAVNQRVCILRPRRVNPRFLAFAANRHAELLAHDDGFNQTHLPNAAFKIMRLSLPPLPEQASIVEALLRATGAIDATLERTSREIDLIREYRTRLVADVVTGKLDVRGMTVGDEADGQSTDAHELAAESPMGDDPLEADEDSAPHAEEVEA
jgi:type I restriction enzyme S subunit